MNLSTETAILFGNSCGSGKIWYRFIRKHWLLDIHFKDDASVKKEKNSAANFSSLKLAASNLLNPINLSSKRRKKIMKEVY